MQNYQRRKLYRVHLKNISQIKNCRNPRSPIAYSSRLYNHEIRINTKPIKPATPNKFIITNNKKKQQNYLINYQRLKENSRITTWLLNTSGSINMHQYEREYEEHKKIMKMHRRVKERRVVMYRIYDIKFKTVSPHLDEVFQIFDLNRVPKKKLMELEKQNTYSDFYEDEPEPGNEVLDTFRGKQALNTLENNQTFLMPNTAPTSTKNSTHQSNLLLTGNIFQLRKSMIKGYIKEKIRLRVVGRMSGEAILQETQMVPIMSNKEVIGSMIVEIC